MRSRRKRIVLVAMAVPAFAVLASLLWIRVTYGVWGIATDPESIPLCEQDYRTGHNGVSTYTSATSITLDPPPIVLEPTVGRLPITFETPERFFRGAAYNGCGSYVLLHVGDDAYVVCGKAGGP
jgi:hypothetical protein